MQIKRYEAKSIQEALGMIKSDLGPEAVVLSTKRLTNEKKGFVEVMAARDDRSEQGYDESGRLTGGASAARAAVKDAAEIKSRQAAADYKNDFEELKAFIVKNSAERSLHREIAEFKTMMRDFFDMMGLRKRFGEMEHFPELYRHLLACGISSKAACILMEKLKEESLPHKIMNYDDTLRALTGLVHKNVVKKSAVKQQTARVKAFIGPTGVGKTTTLAKLAAHYAIEKKMKVGLITTDTFRIAAPEQLRVYAKIIGIPLEVAPDRKGFSRSLRLFADRDVILIDTPGRSRSDHESMQRLKETLHADAPLETSLLLSMTSSRDNLLDNADTYRLFQYDNMILTKMDECNCTGVIYDVLDQVGKPVMYVTDGQNVPQDIEKVSPGRLTEMILGNVLQ